MNLFLLFFFLCCFFRHWWLVDFSEFPIRKVDNGKVSIGTANHQVQAVLGPTAIRETRVVQSTNNGKRPRMVCVVNKDTVQRQNGKDGSVQKTLARRLVFFAVFGFRLWEFKENWVGTNHHRWLGFDYCIYSDGESTEVGERK